MTHGYDNELQAETKKMIIADKNYRKTIISIWKSWKELERISRDQSEPIELRRGRRNLC